MSKTTGLKIHKKKRLGRGLGSLIGENTKNNIFTENINVEKEVSPQFESQSKKGEPSLKAEFKESGERIKDTARIWQIDVAKIFPNLDQPRKVFDPGALKELSESIKEKGVIQPILCRKINENKFEIIAGERRWRATQLAGMHEVPVILKETSNQEVLELALIENIQRQDLNPIEEAEAYGHLLRAHSLTQQQLANKMGKERATIANMLRLLNLGPEVKKMVSHKDLLLGQAKVLLSITDLREQKKLALRIVRDKLSVRATEKLIKKARISKLPPSEVQEARGRHVDHLAEQLQKVLGTKVSIDYSDGKGKLSIYFYSDSELNELSDKVKGACKQ